MARSIVFALTVLLGSCGTGYYRYERTATQDYLIPPGLKAASPDRPARVVVKDVRAACDVTTPSIAMKRKRSSVIVTVAALQQDEPTRVPLEALQDFSKFRDGLDGCLPTVQVAGFLGRVAHSLPLSTRMSHYLVYGAFTTTSVLDLRPPIHLRWVSPESGKVVVSRFKAMPEGKLVRMDGEPGALDRFIARYNHFRLLFLTRAGTQEHTEMLVGAATREDLKKATGSCIEDGRQFGCYQLLRGAVIAAELPVTVDGREVFVPIDGAVRNAVREPVTALTRGPRRTPVRWRAGTDVRGLMLLGGESISTR